MDRLDARALLLAERDRLLAARAAAAAAGVLQADQGQDRAEIGGNLFERDQANAELVTIDAELAAVADALHRVDAGTYGRCTDCGKGIAEERLHAMPMATRCVDDQQRVGRPHLEPA